MANENTESSLVWSPICGVAFIATCCVCGFGWIPYAIAMLFVSNIVGYYVEAKINDLDRVTRIKAKEATGNEQPGDSKELGELVRKTNQILGVFCPAIPVVSLLFGWYMSVKAYRLAKVGAVYTDKSRSKTTVAAIPPMFASDGRCVF